MSPRRARAVRGRVGDDPATALRGHLVDTAEKLLAERPVAGITTRDIARAAGVSDGVLYNYFADKHELIVAALLRRYAAVVARFEAGVPAAGTGTVEENLIRLVQATLDVVADTLPAVGGLISEPALLHRFIAEVHGPELGQHRLRQPIANYLAAERELGRIGEADTGAALTLLHGPAIVLGFNHMIMGTPRAALAEQVPAIVRTLLNGLAPRPTA